MVLCVPFTSRAAASRFDDPLGTASNADIMTLEENYGIMPAAATVVTNYSKTVRSVSGGDYTVVSGNTYSGRVKDICLKPNFAVTNEPIRLIYNFTTSAYVSTMSFGWTFNDVWVYVPVPSSCIKRSGNTYSIDIYFTPSSGVSGLALYVGFADNTNTTITFGELLYELNYAASSNYASCTGLYTSSGLHYSLQGLYMYHMINGVLNEFGSAYNNVRNGSYAFTGKAPSNVYWAAGSTSATTVVYHAGYQYTARFQLYGIDNIKNVRMYDGSNYYNVDSWSIDSSNMLTINWTPYADYKIGSMFFAMDFGSPVAFYRIRCLDIASGYIPAGNTDDINQSVNNNTTIIKNITTTISNTVSNISNTVTTISNNIVKKADEIKSTVTSGLNSLGSSVNNKLQDVKQGVTDKLQDVKTGISNKVDSMSKAVTDKLEDTKKGILDGLKELFIPSENYFSDLVTDLTSYFNDRLGFFSLPIDILLRVGDLVAQAGNADATIPFPEVEWEGQTLISAQNVGVDVLSNSAFKDLQSKIYFVGNVIMIGSLLLLVHRKFEEVLSG